MLLDLNDLGDRGLFLKKAAEHPFQWKHLPFPLKMPGLEPM